MLVERAAITQLWLSWCSAAVGLVFLPFVSKVFIFLSLLDIQLSENCVHAIFCTFPWLLRRHFPFVSFLCFVPMEKKNSVGLSNVHWFHLWHHHISTESTQAFLHWLFALQVIIMFHYFWMVSLYKPRLNHSIYKLQQVKWQFWQKYT